MAIPRIRSTAALALAGAAACTSIPFHRSSSTNGPAAAEAVVDSARPRPYPIFETPGFARAVANGTRTRTGEPGPKYWQQSAHYRIDAELVPQTNQLNGRESVRYFNRSPDTLRTVWMYLNQNLFAPGAPRTEATPVTSGMELLRVAAWGETLAKRDAGPGYTVEGTLLRVALPRPLAPRDSLDMDLAWAFQVPPDGAPREGTTGDVFMIAYWYPQFAVYDDVGGWQRDPYLGTGEFYSDFADYDVTLRVPQGWLVGATGELTNPAEVLSAQTRGRLADARRGVGIVHVVRDEDRGAGATKATTTGFDGVLTWTYRAHNVRDFAFGASRSFVWDAAAAVVGDRDGDRRADTTIVNTLYRPEARRWAWGRSAEFERASIEFLSRYLWPYPWSQMTALEGPASCGGMEYPMLTCIGGPRDTLSLYSVQVHETGHMWFPMQVGSDERRFAWQDEGLTRFDQAQGMQDFFRGYDREAVSREAYLAFARTGGEVPVMRPADQFPAGTPAYGIATYDKTATALVALRAVLGDTTFHSALRTYGLRWLYKHPTPYDFFNSFDALAGRDLSWFWRPWWFETWTLDQAIASAVVEDGKLVVTIRDDGLAPMPVRLAVHREGGLVERREIPADVWLAGARTTTVALDAPSTVTAVEIDPEQVFPDIDRSNNRWTRP
jgi:hypothetical protein